jgi:monoamine oxidase
VLARPARAVGAPRIAIVGGGIAGLSAALTLADKGVAATVFEASDRLGGRMHSDTATWASGQTSEWCGELIDTGHKTILSLAQRFRLATVDLIKAQPQGSTDTDWFLGAYYTADQADADFQPVHQALQRDVQAASYPTTYKQSTPGGRQLDNTSVYDWIESRVPGGHGSAMGRLLDAAYNEEYGAETEVQSALNIVYLLGYNASPGNFAIFGASDERYHIVGGNEQLPQAIAAALPAGAVQLGWAMRSIRRNSDGSLGLTFALSGGGTKTVTADHVVLAMSFAVLRTLDYAKAGFDPLKQTAITQLGAGRNAKLQLQFDSRYWNTAGPWGVSNGNVYTDAGFQNTWDVTRGQPGATGIVVNYSGGDVAGAFAPSTPYSRASTSAQVTTYAQGFLARLEQMWPGISGHWTGRATLSTPFLDPNLNCSYSYWKVGQYQSFAGYEGMRQGNVHFAGEHCSQDFQGYMEGGASEGVRAAGEILGDLGK